MTDEADNVSKAFVFSANNQACLAIYEIVFQATSKSSEGGINYVSGYNESRISVYQVNDGKMLARKKISKQTQDEGTELLAYTNGQLWFYSKNQKLGLYALDALSLEPVVTQQDILDKNPALQTKLANPEWYQINQYYGYDAILNSLIITDVEGFRYTLSPKTLLVVKMVDSRPIPGFPDRYLGTSTNFKYQTISFQGDIRETIRYNSKDINPELSFIDPQFVQEQNRKKIYDRQLIESLKLRDNLDLINIELDSLKNRGAFSYKSDEYRYSRMVENQKYQLERALKESERNLQNLEKGNIMHYYLPQQIDSSSFLIIHRSNTNKNALLNISALSLTNDSVLQEKWKTNIPDIFYNPSDARETDDFKRVFSKGDPEFGFQFFEISGDRLIVIYMLHAFGIDLNSGMILWKFRI